MPAFLIGLVGALVGKVADFFIGRVVLEKAYQYALTTAFIVTVAGLFVALTLSVKALIIGARVVMPPMLAQVTYFLPPSMPMMISTVITIRVMVSIYRWTVATFSAYLPKWNNFGMRI